MTEEMLALKNLYLQHHGLKNHWCGMWLDCDKCKRTFAFGGNWGSDDQKCPYCEASKYFIDENGFLK